MATPNLEVRILRDLGCAGGTEPDWLECEDACGIFYYSRRTKQAAIELPPEVLAAVEAMPAAPLYVPPPLSMAQQAVVLMRVGHWVIAEDALGVFYQNVVSLESFEQPPPELVLLLAKKREAEELQLRQQQLLQLQKQQKQQQRQQLQLELRRKWEEQYGQQNPRYAPGPQQLQLNHAAAASQALSLPSAKEAVVKMRIANWAIAQDSMGEFYQNMATGESFDNPPAELVRILRQRVGSTPTQATPTQRTPTWHDLAAEAQPQYRSWAVDSLGIHFR
eukprot:CAMPEP_0170595884 /NCGR_PEP_ID=MMETSP0224-20130122/14805_1 /TAXON_ID=285029 /ORGANISM="Togula jolla, Strain CCCM 725" /LENGTH=276 /DNA_ID=CAMNT_0010920105 /DNA_START=70 /DNA_END=900 /DNA_ORIENTATION=+